ncbi:hypothetical protein HID58_061547 [Brassica napus]|uniref:ArsA/GET3 Anion-transporting ATPase-like domain-containing protein n=1 Tax=Brassica napus TaxID=3708 RepID=A0ABQ7ZYV8_BRANA|nr:hypothetical protein HID58_061547 [Brassica napus]
MSCMGARMGLGMFAGEVLQFMESPEYNRFTHIVFDTAPTLSLAIFDIQLKKKITAAASAFTSVFDKKEMQQQGPSNELDQLKDRMEKVLNVFCDVDTTEFVIVTIPTLSEFNFSGNHKSFTIARIFDPTDRIPGPFFAPHGGAHNPDDDKHGKKCASSKFHFGVSSGCNPPEGGDEPKEPSDAEGTIPNSEQ